MDETIKVDKLEEQIERQTDRQENRARDKMNGCVRE